MERRRKQLKERKAKIVENQEQEKQNVMWLQRKEFEWGVLYSTTLKSYPNKKPYYMSIRFNKDIAPPREQIVNKVNVKKWFLSAYEDKRDGSVHPMLFINEFEDLTEQQQDLEYDEVALINDDIPF